MSFDEVLSGVREKVSMAVGLNATVKLDFGDDGVIFVDATQTPPVVSDEDGEADTTIICSLDLFKDIVKGDQDPNIAFMMGKLKVQGSMGVAMKLNGILEG